MLALSCTLALIAFAGCESVGPGGPTVDTGRTSAALVRDGRVEPLEIFTEFFPSAPFASTESRVEAPAVFVGYGVTPRTSLDWMECDFADDELTFLGRRLDPSRLRCGFLTVPENHVHPTEATVRLAFAVMAAEQPSDAPPLLYLIGGPGGAALNPLVLAFEAPALARVRDVVVFDQRGTGRSRPLLCPEMDRAEIEQAAMDLTPAEEHAERRRAQRACVEQLAADGIDPAAYGIASTVADVEALRASLGFARWDLYGESVGGVLAQYLIRAHPRTVRSAILAKPVPTDWSNFVRHVPNQAAGLTRIYDGCAADPGCADAFPDPEGDLLAAHEALVNDPWTVTVDTGVVASGEFTINAIDFMGLVAGMLYAEFKFRYLPAVLRAFAERDERVAATVLEQAFGGAAYDGLAIKYTFWCRDAAWAAAIGAWEHAAEPYPDALRDIGFIHLEDCEEWPAAPSSPENRRSVRTDVPVLILSGAYDSVIPPSIGMDQLAGFPNGRQVIFPFSAHTIPSNEETAACAYEVMNDFLDDPGGALDTSCVAGLPPIEYATEPP